MFKIMTIAAMLVASPAFAQDNDQRPVLWGKLRVGMSKEEVKAVLPKSSVDLGNGCKIDAYPRFGDGKLKRIEMDMQESFSPGSLQCGIQIRDAIVAKYGPATEGDGTNDCDFNFTKSMSLAGVCSLSSRIPLREMIEYSYYSWRTDGVEILFKLNKAHPDRWSAVYRPIPKVDPTLADKM